MIDYEPTTGVIHLHNQLISYVLQIEPNGVLIHRYWGPNLRHWRLDALNQPERTGQTPVLADADIALGSICAEWPGGGQGDYRYPAFQMRQHNGSPLASLRFKALQIREGKPVLEGLPQFFVVSDDEAETLVLTLTDTTTAVEVTLYYTIYRAFASIIRRVEVRNLGAVPVRLDEIMSASIDLRPQAFDVIQLNGDWAREANVEREPVHTGTKVLRSNRGMSSAQQNPFFALVTPETTEQSGEVFGFALVYSGNFICRIEKDPNALVRAQIGIDSENFSWHLDPGAQFETPEAVLTYSEAGLNGMSQIFHQIIGQRLIPTRYQHMERPILVNNWEATTFNFDRERLLKIAKAGQAVGAELFVLDDGWFGHRDDDTSSLGDWVEYPGKLQGGLVGLSKTIHRWGMKFGLWFEPEMISQNSQLYRTHPDWRLCDPSYTPAVGRHQYLLDLTMPAVRDYLFERISAVIDLVGIDYIKWDMNRPMTDVFSCHLPADQQGEVAHRYVLGLYALISRLTARYPQVLFEGCASGGGRFDMGMLAYMPQIWTSDNTDAIARLRIQYGTSLIYPQSTMGAHVSAAPNEQVGRMTTIETRQNVATSGVLGYELDLTELTTADVDAVKARVKQYKQLRQLLQYGRMIRLRSPFETNEASWVIVDETQTQAVVFFTRVLAQANQLVMPLKLAGLDARADYRVEGRICGGDELMSVGLTLTPPRHQDFWSKMLVLERVSSD
ncbi:alpha-galactosidase [Lacticaseibacillus daqingensis]|uniref:alpha-galactosidase n=1 Tax=Lacticaseibacillus daqingensis TaxID=2486014 RepID=UPI000F7ABCB5|nr:alpha-galactosidase [Lacticaseibacillus daqingensis]